MAERGEHRRLMVHDLLRVLAHERETCMLQVKERLSAGHFMLVRGKIVSAVCDSQEGEAAARTMLGWESPWLRVEDAPALLHAPFHVETDEQTPLCMAS
jgi:hypothetical protein